MKAQSNKSHIKIAALIALVMVTISIALFSRNVVLKRTFQKKKYISNILSPEETAEIHKKNNPNVKIVWNNKEGLWDKQGIKKVELVHELTIDNDPNKDFYRIITVAADYNDNIYLSELFEGTIRKYNKNGEYLLTIGRKGNGPGEFIGPDLKINMDTNNNLVIYDLLNNRINQFQPDGQYVNSFNLSQSFSNPVVGFVLTDSDYFYISSYKNETETIIHKYNNEGTLIKSFGEPLLFKKPVSSSDYEIKKKNSKGPLAIDTDRLLYTQMNPYEIRLYSLEGALKTVIFRKNDFMPPDKIEIIGKNSIKSQMPVFSSLIGTWEGFIVNCVYIPPYITNDIGSVIDIYNSEGQLMQSFQLKDRICFTHIDLNGKLYGFCTASNDSVEKVFRFKLKLLQ